MSQMDTGYGQPPAMTPPQYAGEMPKTASTWPTVIGIILIVVGSIGIILNVCGAVFTYILPALMSQAAQQTNDPTVQAQMDTLQKYVWFNLGDAIVLLFLGALLLVAGIGVLKRRQSGVKWSRVWALSRIIWTIPASYYTYVMTEESLKAAEQAAADSGQTAPAMGGFFQAIGVASVVLSVIIACAIPVFILIWFSLGKIKAETSTWP